MDLERRKKNSKELLVGQKGLVSRIVDFTMYEFKCHYLTEWTTTIHIGKKAV